MLVNITRSATESRFVAVPDYITVQIIIVRVSPSCDHHTYNIYISPTQKTAPPHQLLNPLDESRQHLLGLLLSAFGAPD